MVVEARQQISTKISLRVSDTDFQIRMRLRISGFGFLGSEYGFYSVQSIFVLLADVSTKPNPKIRSRKNRMHKNHAPNIGAARKKKSENPYPETRRKP